MKRPPLGLSLICVAAPVLAEPSCTPGAPVKPVWESIKSLRMVAAKCCHSRLTTAKAMKFTAPKDDKKTEVFLDPNTSAELGRAEG